MSSAPPAHSTTSLDDERVRVTTGEPYLGHAGTEHDVVNRSGGPATFVEIELKG